MLGEEVTPEVFIPITSQCGVGVEVPATDKSLLCVIMCCYSSNGSSKSTQGAAIISLFLVAIEINVQYLPVNRWGIYRAAFLATRCTLLFLDLKVYQFLGKIERALLK